MCAMMRVGSVNEGSTLKQSFVVDFREPSPAAVLRQVDASIDTLVEIVHRAGKAGCDVITFPETTLALSRWEGAHRDRVGEVLPEAVRRLLERLGEAAASHNMYLVCCNDTYGDDGKVRNTAFFLGRDGGEIGRYHKIGLPLHEQTKEPGGALPVFQTPDLGGVGLLICYDMVFPELPRCMALGGADIIFNPTEGGAAFGGPDISRAAFRTRAVENFVYIVVSWGGGNKNTGSMIISPHGDILADEREPGEIAIVDLDPFAGRENADFANSQADMRARLFRERRPWLYGRLTDPHPPILDRLPDYTPGTAAEIADIYQRGTTVGHIEWDAAEALLAEGQLDAAEHAFLAMQRNYRGSWFDRMAVDRLKAIDEKRQGAAST